MEAVIHQAFGDVFHGDALELAQVQDALVRDEIAVAAVEDGEIVLEPPGDVIRIEDGILRRLCQPRRRPWR